MTVPFIMLLIVTIALILERKFQEDKIKEIYEDKFQNWKKHSKQNEKESIKELVGLVYMKEYQISIEIIDDRAIDPLNRKSYTIKPLKGNKNENHTNTTS